MQASISRSLLLLALLGLSVEAQEVGNPIDERTRAAEIDALEPGVTTEDLSTGLAPVEQQPGVEGSTSADLQANPAPAVLAQETRRRPTNSGVMDEIDLDRTEITGNQELPKVLYIVPWQKSDPGDLTGKPINTLLDEVLAPVDRTEFRRQVNYYDDLYRTTEQ